MNGSNTLITSGLESGLSPQVTHRGVAQPAWPVHGLASHNCVVSLGDWRLLPWRSFKLEVALFRRSRDISTDVFHMGGGGVVLSQVTNGFHIDVLTVTDSPPRQPKVKTIEACFLVVLFLSELSNNTSRKPDLYRSCYTEHGQRS